MPTVGFSVFVFYSNIFFIFFWYFPGVVSKEEMRAAAELLKQKLNNEEVCFHLHKSNVVVEIEKLFFF
jgi:hypothetical protein